MPLPPPQPQPRCQAPYHPGRDRPEPDDSAFTQALKRLGVAPLRHLFLQVARPMASHQTRGALHRRWRLMGIDGTTLDLPDTLANARTFGRPKGSRADAAFPQVRLLAICELGTHAVCGLAIKPIRHGETSVLGQLLAEIGPGMLLIWDRGFFGFELIDSVCRRGAHLQARAKSNAILRPIHHLADGTYLARIYPTQVDRRRDTRGRDIRVIESTHDDSNRPCFGQRHRLITDLLNPDELPALEAPLAYHERWEQELLFDEIKSHLSGREVPIRSKTPAGVVQEIYGLMLAHYVVRRVIHDAAVVAMHDRDRISFIDSLRVLQCRLPESPGLKVEEWFRLLLKEVRRQEFRSRRDRRYARVIKRKMSNWKKKRSGHCGPPQPTKPFREVAVLLV